MGNDLKRVQYRKLSGDGPESGWVSIWTSTGKTLLFPHARAFAGNARMYLNRHCAKVCEFSNTQHLKVDVEDMTYTRLQQTHQAACIILEWLEQIQHARKEELLA